MLELLEGLTEEQRGEIRDYLQTADIRFRRRAAAVPLTLRVTCGPETGKPACA